jgi:hypothetical protein
MEKPTLFLPLKSGALVNCRKKNDEESFFDSLKRKFQRIRKMS